MIGVVDYGMGNIGSVKRKLDRIHAQSIVSQNPDELRICSKLILPGVGHFASAVGKLKYLGLWDFIHESVISRKIPILGICLGMQLMAKTSEEGNVRGFGWFDADVVKFKIKDTTIYKVPHMGWNTVELKRSISMFDDVPLDKGFYFVHAYHFRCNEEADVVGMTVYEYPFVSCVQKEHIFGVQFHPEKSHEAGEKLLLNFLTA